MFYFKVIFSKMDSFDSILYLYLSLILAFIFIFYQQNIEILYSAGVSFLGFIILKCPKKILSIF